MRKFRTLLFLSFLIFLILISTFDAAALEITSNNLPIGQHFLSLCWLCLCIGLIFLVIISIIQNIVKKLSNSEEEDDFFQTIVSEMSKGNFSFLILIFGILCFFTSAAQVVLMSINLYNKK